MALDPGEPAPSIAADNQWGERVSPDFEGAAVVYFYPKDHTPGCTAEAEGFDERMDRFEEATISVYGVSTDCVEEQCEFAETHDLDFDLLADPDGGIAEVFDVALDDDGRAERATFVIARGRVVGVYEGVRPEGHAREVLRDLAEVGLVPMGSH